MYSDGRKKERKLCTVEGPPRTSLQNHFEIRPLFHVATYKPENGNQGLSRVLMSDSPQSAGKVTESLDFSYFGGAESLFEGRSPRRTVVNSPTHKDGGKSYPAPPQDPSDFLWLMTEEPHRSRRLAILKAHPEVTKLMGYEPLTKWLVLGVVLLQITVAICLRHSRPTSPLFLFCAYALGGTANQNLFLAIHEITHNLAFKGVNANKVLAIFANIPIGIPYSAAFKKYHIEHHKHLGEDGIDTDLPSRLELLCLNNVLGKTFFATFQILFYAIRPGFVRTQTPTKWHFYNLVIQIAFDVLLVQTYGVRPLIYLIMSSFFAGSLHPCASHFIAEHYLWDGLDQETYSYYGCLNWLAYNVGYHNEHHDFPSVAWTRLPALRALAPEFYDIIPSHPSWPMVTINFIRDKEMGIFSRAKRLGRGVKTPDPKGPANVVKASRRYETASDDDDSVSDSGVSVGTGVKRGEEWEESEKKTN